MANNVTNIIKIVANEEATRAIDNRFESAGGYSDVAMFVKAFYDNPEISENGGVMNSWSLDNVGSKWIYVENNIDSGEWNIQSANYPPQEFLQRLYELVTEIDPEGYIENRYNDEGYSPVGAMVFKKDEQGPKWVEIEDHDWDNPADDMEWDDEGYDEAQMNFMDDIYDFQEKSIQRCHSIIEKGEGEPFKQVKVSE